MAHKDLRTHLGLPETASAKDINTAYTTRKSELEERGSSAPTETLKKAYDTALEELENLYRGLEIEQENDASDDQDLTKEQPESSHDDRTTPELVTSKTHVTKIIASIVAAGILVFFALSYPKWSPSLLHLFQDTKLTTDVETAHSSALDKQKHWETSESVPHSPSPPEITRAEELLRRGDNLTAENKLKEALTSYTEADKLYEKAITKQMNLLYSKVLDTQERVLALKERLEEQKTILDERIQTTRSQILKYERQEQKISLAQAKTELIFLETLKTLCDRDIFNGSEVFLINDKIKIAAGMILEERYSDALEVFQESETLLQGLLPRMASVEKALTEKFKALNAAKQWQTISAQNIGKLEEIHQAESDLNKANSFLEDCSWLQAADTYQSAQNFYRSAIIKSETILKEREAKKLAATQKEAAEKKEFVDKILSDFVKVPGGCYQMGDIFDDGYSDEKPVHDVCVDGFSIGKYEITQGLWKVIMGNNPSYFKKGDSYPVESVSWNDVDEFLKQLNKKTGREFRLPTEAEWEYAARSGGRQEKYSGGDNVDDVAWHNDNSASSTHSVGSKIPNGLGLYDMSGNVWEWCSDWFNDKYYSTSPRDNPQGPSSGSFRANRGGSWNYKKRFARTSYRRGRGTDRRKGTLGFRIVEDSVDSSNLSGSPK